MQISRLNCIAHKSTGVGKQQLQSVKGKKGKIGKRQGSSGKKADKSVGKSAGLSVVKAGKKQQAPKQRKQPAPPANLLRSIRKRRAA